MFSLLAISALLAGAWKRCEHYRARALAELCPPQPLSASFSCDGQTYCSQMTSCQEAIYFLKMDGNNDRAV